MCNFVDFGEKVLQKWRQKGYKQQELSIRTGYSKQVISQFKTRKKWEHAMLQKLALAFGYEKVEHFLNFILKQEEHEVPPAEKKDDTPKKELPRILIEVHPSTDFEKLKGFIDKMKEAFEVLR